MLEFLQKHVLLSLYEGTLFSFIYTQYLNYVLFILLILFISSECFRLFFLHVNSSYALRPSSCAVFHCSHVYLCVYSFIHCLLRSMHSLDMALKEGASLPSAAWKPLILSLSLFNISYYKFLETLICYLTNLSISKFPREHLVHSKNSKMFVKTVSKLPCTLYEV